MIKGLVLAVIMLNMIGCASYYSHYGSFSAQNSAGEERMYVVSWKTAEYPSWAIQDNKATEITLETQCSNREWVLADSSTAKSVCTEAHEGIVACGDQNLDLSLAGKPLADSNQLCMSISDDRSAKKTVELGSSVLVSVSCLPSVITREEDGEKVNIDYLKASVVPYSVATRKVERYSFADKAPKLTRKICEDAE